MNRLLQGNYWRNFAMGRCNQILCHPHERYHIPFQLGFLHRLFGMHLLDLNQDPHLSSYLPFLLSFLDSEHLKISTIYSTQKPQKQNRLFHVLSLRGSLNKSGQTMKQQRRKIQNKVIEQKKKEMLLWFLLLHLSIMMKPE